MCTDREEVDFGSVINQCIDLEWSTFPVAENLVARLATSRNRRQMAKRREVLAGGVGHTQAKTQWKFLRRS